MLLLSSKTAISHPGEGILSTLAWHWPGSAPAREQRVRGRFLRVFLSLPAMQPVTCLLRPHSIPRLFSQVCGTLFLFSKISLDPPAPTYRLLVRTQVTTVYLGLCFLALMSRCQCFLDFNYFSSWFTDRSLPKNGCMGHKLCSCKSEHFFIWSLHFTSGLTA